MLVYLHWRVPCAIRVKPIRVGHGVRTSCIQCDGCASTTDSIENSLLTIKICPQCEVHIKNFVPLFCQINKVFCLFYLM